MITVVLWNKLNFWCLFEISNIQDVSMIYMSSIYMGSFVDDLLEWVLNDEKWPTLPARPKAKSPSQLMQVPACFF